MPTWNLSSPDKGATSAECDGNSWTRSFPRTFVPSAFESRRMFYRDLKLRRDLRQILATPGMYPDLFPTNQLEAADQLGRTEPFGPLVCPFYLYEHPTTRPYVLRWKRNIKILHGDDPTDYANPSNRNGAPSLGVFLHAPAPEDPLTPLGGTTNPRMHQLCQRRHHAGRGFQTLWCPPHRVLLLPSPPRLQLLRPPSHVSSAVTKGPRKSTRCRCASPLPASVRTLTCAP